MQNFRLSTAHVKFHRNCTLISSFCWKYIKFQLKSTEELCVIILKSDAKFEEKPICCFKNDKNLVNFDLSTQVSKICTVICPFCATFDQKKHRGVIFNDTEESCKIWRKAGFWLWKVTQEIWQIFIRTFEIGKIGTFMKSFCPK